MKALLIVLLCALALVADDNLQLSTVHYEMGQFCRSKPFVISQDRETKFYVDLGDKSVIMSEPSNTR